MSDNLHVTIEIICPICGASGPQRTRGCDLAGCTWRAEAAAEMLNDGGSAHVVSVSTDRATRQSTVSLAIWPKVQGNG